ncbi:MAG: thiamine-phosphate kinase [Gammaproteobacteria bacterium]|nr:thiamine-phosphate kinase [Gammaproteobacteria bacterium]NNC97712.1 thiamine-phosphate kinase [Gammaproteobacteria bacterium]NNM14048.1 thiamine-phosphate kinase [Gammaproteobacteria bacterium]
MTEDELIQTFFTSDVTDPYVILGVGDDAAILQVPDAHQLITSVDTLLEGVHFPSNFDPELLASRCLGVTLSDLAAMGATPKWITLSLSLPEVDTAWLQIFSRALKRECQAYAVQLVGGDTVKGPLALSLTVMGIVASGQALRRDQANVGDQLYVSGCLGGAMFALECLQNNLDCNQELLQHYTAPQARVLLGQKLLGHANSCMDISDGLLLDASRLARTSKVGIQIAMEKLPLHPALAALDLDKRLKLACAGDDYELLFSAPDTEAEFLKGLSQRLGLPISCIGEITAGEGVTTTLYDQPYQQSDTGYQHFR